MVKCTFDKSIISVQFTEELILRELTEWFKVVVLSTIKDFILHRFESYTLWFMFIIALKIIVFYFRVNYYINFYSLIYKLKIKI